MSFIKDKILLMSLQSCSTCENLVFVHASQTPTDVRGTSVACAKISKTSNCSIKTKRMTSYFKSVSLVHSFAASLASSKSNVCLCPPLNYPTPIVCFYLPCPHQLLIPMYSH